MRYKIIQIKDKNDPRPFKIMSRESGLLVGTSENRENAMKSIRYREEHVPKKTKTVSSSTKKGGKKHKA